MSRFEACLFDYGNTIVEFDRRQMDFIRRHLTASFCRLVGPIELEVLAEALDRVCLLPFIGNPPPLRELEPVEQMQVLLLRAYGDGAQFTLELAAELNGVLQDLFVDSIAIEAGTIECLESLSRRVRVGLVSNYPCGNAIRRSLKKVGLDRLLDPVVISGEVGFVKPHSEPFRAALDLLGLPAEAVLFVGDRWEADMVGAKNVGMKTCHHLGYTWDHDLEERYRTYRPDFQINRLADLEKIVMGAF